MGSPYKGILEAFGSAMLDVTSQEIKRQAGLPTGQSSGLSFRELVDEAFDDLRVAWVGDHVAAVTFQVAPPNLLAVHEVGQAVAVCIDPGFRFRQVPAGLMFHLLERNGKSFFAQWQVQDVGDGPGLRCQGVAAKAGLTPEYLRQIAGCAVVEAQGLKTRADRG